MTAERIVPFKRVRKEKRIVCPSRTWSTHHCTEGHQSPNTYLLRRPEPSTLHPFNSCYQSANICWRDFGASGGSSFSRRFAPLPAGGVFSSRNLLFLSAFYGALPDGPRKSDRATRRAGWCRELDVCQNRQTSVSSASCQTSLSRPQRVQPAANPGWRGGSVEIKSHSLKTE